MRGTALAAPPGAAVVPPRWRRLVLPGTLGGTVLGLTAGLHFRDPHVRGSWGFCPIAALGYACPGCGGLRAVNDLTHLQVVDAASSNLLFVAAIPFILYAYARWVRGRWTGVAWNPPDRAQLWSAIGIVALLVVFTAARNLPFGTWLAP